MNSYFQDKKVLLTGAAGFLGSHLTERLLDLGAKVTGVDNYITGQEKNLESIPAKKKANFKFIEADVTQPPESYLDEKTFDIILHFASPASPPRYQELPRETYLVNSIATDHLLNYLKKTNPKGRFLFAGTSEAYGDPKVHPQPETYWGNVNPNGPRSCYDESKRLGETICGVFHRSYDMDARIIRIFNTYGSKMDSEDGRVLTNFITQALAGDPLTIFGDGSQTRSYCYVSDLIEGILKFVATDGLDGETINLGNPEEFTIMETAETVWKSIQGDKKLKLDYRDLPIDDPTRRQPDISKAKKLLGWEPKVKFEDGLKEMVEYFRE